MQPNRQPIIAIDGPAGAGKSTVASLVADRLGLIYLDTGAMYRAITLAIMRSGIDPSQDLAAIAPILSQTQLQLLPAQVLLNGIDVSREIRSVEVTAQVSAIAAIAEVRAVLSQQQQTYGLVGGVVMEGRDIGTQIFPDAELKIFLTASVQERAQRRQQQLIASGETDTEIDQIVQSIAERDFKDSNRDIAPLVQAIDAIKVDTDGRSIAEIVESIVELYDSRHLSQDLPR